MNRLRNIQALEGIPVDSSFQYQKVKISRKQ